MNKAIMGLLFIVVGLPFSMIWHGYALTKLWEWFAVPLFNLPPLPLAGAVGLFVLVRFAASHPQTPDTNGKDFATLMAEGVSQAVMMPAISLLIGWIVSHWMPAI